MASLRSRWRSQVLDSVASSRRGGVARRIYGVVAEQRTRRYKIAGMGAANLDFIAVVANYPQPDQKLRTEAFEVQGGGNCANTLTGIAKLGLNPYLLTKARQPHSAAISHLPAEGRMRFDVTARELNADGVNTDWVVVGEGAPSAFTYVIVDQTGDTRTCIHTPTDTLDPSELSQEQISLFLENAELVYFDGRFPEAAMLVAERAREMQIPVVVEGERLRPNLEQLLSMADIIVTSKDFPSAFSGEENLGEALGVLLQRFRNARLIVTTLGVKGSVAMEIGQQAPNGVIKTALGDVLEEQWAKQSQTEVSKTDPHCISRNQTPIWYGNAVVSEEFCPALKQSVDESTPVQAATPGSIQRTDVEPESRQGVVSIRLTTASAAQISPDAIVDTTGAGDAFIAGLLYGFAHELPLESTLKFAALVAACKCTELGARPGQPSLTNIKHIYKSADF